MKPIRPIPAPPAAFSPHVRRNSSTDRRTPAFTPAPSSMTTGSTRNVVSRQARPTRPLTMLPRKPSRSSIARRTALTVAEMPAQPRSAGHRLPGPAPAPPTARAEDPRPPARGRGQARADRRGAAAQRDVGLGDQARVEEDRDERRDEVE